MLKIISINFRLEKYRELYPSRSKFEIDRDNVHYDALRERLNARLLKLRKKYTKLDEDIKSFLGR